MFLAEGQYNLGGAELQVQAGVKLILRSSGAGAVLDAAGASRLFSIIGRGSILILEQIHLVNGVAEEVRAIARMCDLLRLMLPAAALRMHPC